MSFSYDPDNILTNDLDWVRFTIEDTDSSDYLIEDEEITALLVDYDKGIVAYLCAKKAYLKLARRFKTKKQRDTTIGFDVAAYLRAYTELVDELNDKYNSTGGVFSGGVDGDHAFTVGQFDDPSNPQAGKEE